MNTGAAFASGPAGDGVLRLSGVLTMANVDAALADSEHWPESVHTIDLSGISHSDSAGVALLLEWWRRARRRGHDLTYSHAPQQMRAIIEVSGLAQILPMAEAAASEA